MSGEFGHIDDKLDPRVLVAVLILSIVEFEVFTFSKTTVEESKQDAWLGVIVGILVGLFCVFLFVKLAARFPGKGYFDILRIVWGRPLGTIFSVTYLLFWVPFITSMFYETTMANNMLFLPRTPEVIPLLIFGLSLAWLISYGIAPIVRFFQLMLPFLLAPLLLLALLFIPSLDMDNFRPVLAGGFMPVLKAGFYFLGAYQGPEVLLFIAPFITQIQKGTKAALLGYATPSLIGWTNTTAALGILGVVGVKEAVLPGINVVTLIEMPGFPVERFGLLLTLPWLIAIYTTMAIYLYLLCYGVIQFLNIRRRKMAIYTLTLLPAALSQFVPNSVWHEHLRAYITLATPYLVYLLPVVTLGLAVVRKKGDSNNEG